MRKIILSDTKPRNYDYLTFKIIASIPHEGKADFLKSLEELLLKSIIKLPPQEIKVDLDSVRIFVGKNKSRVMSIWFMEISRARKLANLLVKLNRIKLN